MAYTLIHRTGLSRGRVYNGTGDNLTAAPQGAGNDQVGPFAQDYSSIMFDQNLNYDHEFSGVIMDGRALRGGGNSDDSILYPDLDEDEDLSDRGSVVGRDTNIAGVSSVSVKLTHTRPRWADAQVWEVPVDGSEPTTGFSLDEWLDLDSGEMPNYNRHWSRMRHYLQCPYYWALYKVPLGPNYEGLAEMIAENTASAVGQLGQLSYGPLGMLTALHGSLYALAHAYRLYEPAGAIIPVERGYGLMQYDNTFNDGVFTGTGDNDPDLTDDTETAVIQRQLRSTANANYRRGGLETWGVHSKSRVKADPEMLYIWHWATAPVRIGIIEPAGGGTSHVVVGNAVSPYYGPFVHTVYHECTARYYAR